MRLKGLEGVKIMGKLDIFTTRDLSCSFSKITLTYAGIVYLFYTKVK